MAPSDGDIGGEQRLLRVANWYVVIGIFKNDCVKYTDHDGQTSDGLEVSAEAYLTH